MLMDHQVNSYQALAQAPRRRVAPWPIRKIAHSSIRPRGVLHRDALLLRRPQLPSSFRAGTCRIQGI